MPIFAASSGMVIPGWPCTKESACAARVPLPLRRPARRFPGGRPGLRLAFVAVRFVVVRVALERVAEPLGRPGPRRPGVVAVGDEPRTAAHAQAAACIRLESSTDGLGVFRRVPA